MHACMLSRFSHVRLFVTPWSTAHQALFMGFSRQEHWSGLPCPLPGDLLNPEIEPTSLTSPALAGEFFTISSVWEAPHLLWKVLISSLEYDTLLRWLRQENLQGSFNSGSREEPWQSTFYLLKSAWYLSYGQDQRMSHWACKPASPELLSLFLLFTGFCFRVSFKTGISAVKNNSQ